MERLSLGKIPGSWDADALYPGSAAASVVTVDRFAERAFL